MHDGAMFACTSPEGHAYAECPRARSWWDERAARAVEVDERVPGGLSGADPAELALAVHDASLAPCSECDRAGGPRREECGSRGDPYYRGKAESLSAAAGRCR
jgi:hypothetical protein